MKWVKVNRIDSFNLLEGSLLIFWDVRLSATVYESEFNVDGLSVVQIVDYLGYLFFKLGDKLFIILKLVFVKIVFDSFYLGFVYLVLIFIKFF